MLLQHLVHLHTATRDSPVIISVQHAPRSVSVAPTPQTLAAFYEEGRAALQVAAKCGDTSFVEQLLEESAKVDTPASVLVERTIPSRY